MGLNIHYSLKLDFGGAELAREKLTALRKFALDLAFADVGELVEFQAEDDTLDLDSPKAEPLSDRKTRRSKRDRYDSQREIKANANRGIFYERYHFTVPAQQGIYFQAWPGEGCETALFGLATYPKTIIRKIDNQLEPIETNLSGWCWFNLCKTQYASNPNYGGIEHFLKCHLLLIAMLDEAQRLDILQNVSDDGSYWENRDIEELIKALEKHNALVAAIVGQIGDVLNKVGKGEAQAPITSYPNFEYLEAEGQMRLKGNRPNKAE
ncbi:MAG TPA: hypothetical protein V6D33_06780 [Cyanophyceae cyanobacterium]